MTNPEPPPEELRSKYHFGSLYVTYIPINDLTQLLNDSGRLSQFKQESSKPDAVDSFKTFLDKNPSGPINEGIAFLQLDLNNSKAGFKRISDRDGVIHPVSWSESDVQGIAELCDVYFNHLVQFEEKYESIRARQASLKQAWAHVTELKEDPFLTNSKIARLLGNFKVLVDEKPDELKALKFDDGATYAAIRNVRSEYDTYLSKQQNEQPLASLWSKETDIADHIKGIKTAKLNIYTSLMEEEVIAGLKDSVAVFDDLGYLSRLEPSNMEELLQVNRCLKTSAKDRLKLDTSTQLEFGSPDLEVFGGIFDKGPLR